MRGNCTTNDCSTEVPSTWSLQPHCEEEEEAPDPSPGNGCLPKSHLAQEPELEHTGLRLVRPILRSQSAPRDVFPPWRLEGQDLKHETNVDT